MLERMHRTASRRFAVCAAVVVAVAGLSEGSHALAIESLGWLAGCWAGNLADGSSYEEMWLAPRGGVMLGVTRTVRDEKAVGHEFLRIAEEDGALVYLADPSGQEPAPFTAIEVGDREVTFANLEHDFPQKIRYRLEAPDRLLARIEGEREGRTRSVDFPMRSAPCPQ